MMEGEVQVQKAYLLAVYIFMLVWCEIFSIKMRLQDAQNNDITNLKTLLTKFHAAIKFEDKIRILGHSAFFSRS